MSLSSGSGSLSGSKYLNPLKMDDYLSPIKDISGSIPGWNAPSRVTVTDFLGSSSNPSKLRITGTTKLPREGRQIHMSELGVGGKAKNYSFQKRGSMWREVDQHGNLSHKSGIRIWKPIIENGEFTGVKMSRGTSAQSKDGFTGASFDASKIIGYQSGGLSGFLGSVGKGLMLPFSLLAKLFGGIFGGKGGKEESFSRGIPKGSSRQAQNVREFVDIEKGIKQLQEKESTLGRGIQSWGTDVKDFSKTLSGDELSETWRVILGLGKRHGGKEAMKSYDSQVKFHGPNAFDKLIGADDKPMGRSGMIDILKRSGVRGFQKGGRYTNPIAGSGLSKKKLDEITKEHAYLPLPQEAGGGIATGIARGGFGASLRLNVMDSRLSGYAMVNDPAVQKTKADIQKAHQKNIQKKFEKQAKDDQLVQSVVGALVSAGVAAAGQGLSNAFQAKAGGAGVGDLPKDVRGPMRADIKAAGGKDAFAQQQGYENWKTFYQSASIMGTQPTSMGGGPGSYQHRPTRYGAPRAMRLDQMRGPIDIARATDPGRLNANWTGKIGPIQQEVAPGVYRNDPAYQRGVSAPTSRPGSGLVGGRFRPSGPQNVGRPLDASDFPSGVPRRALQGDSRRQMTGDWSKREGAIAELWEASNRTLHEISKFIEEDKKLQPWERTLQQLQDAGNFLDRRQAGGYIGPNAYQAGGKVGGGDSGSTVNISINTGGGDKPGAALTSGSETIEGDIGHERKLALKIKRAVLSVLADEKRVGGSMRNPAVQDQ